MCILTVYTSTNYDNYWNTNAIIDLNYDFNFKIFTNVNFI